MSMEPWLERWAARAIENRKRCSRCVYDDQTPGIIFDEEGVCNYCKQAEELELQFPTGAEGWKILESLADKINNESKGKKYNVVVGVSGGCDSSYTLYIAKQLGLRPLAVHYDNTWNSEIAVSNIRNVLDALDTELSTYVVDNEEMDDIFRSFFKAGVIELDGPTDMALVAVQFRAAMKHGIKYLFSGHSFRTEGVSPLNWNYVDGKYIQDIQRRFGNKPIRSFPNLTLPFQLRCMFFGHIKRIRPLWYVDYVKENAKTFMSEKLGWQWYGGHHLENRMTAFNHTYWVPRGFGQDWRVNGYAALVRSGQMPREEGIRKLQQPPRVDYELVELFKKRLGFSNAEFERYMEAPKNSWQDFNTYKPTFERLRPLFRIASDLGYVPKSFYLKYCFKKSA